MAKAAKPSKPAISPTRAENYPEWYQQVVRAAEMAENSPVRGCMVIRPWGYALWENMQAALDARFKATGHENAYFPLFIPMSFLEQEAEHVEGFAKECAVVTHHRLEPGKDGGLVPAGKLEEPLIVRPTSETIIGATYAKWVQSYRDLPIKINQWANVVRWELRTRLFLRTTEFLWQEGHTVHASAEEAMEETLLILDEYANFAETHMAMPVVKGEKTPDERFPGAVNTYSIEALMQDNKALQAGTSHFLGQNFAKAQDISFAAEDGSQQFAWTTSWGVSTRLVGGLIMTHADDDGLRLPPRLAPKHVVLLPIYRKDADRSRVLDYCENLRGRLAGQTYHGRPLEVVVDDRDLHGGEKSWQWVKKGIPLRVEIGPRDIDSGSVFVGRRDKGVKEKQSMPKDQFVSGVVGILDDMQQGMFDAAAAYRDAATRDIDSLDDFRSYFAGEDAPGFALANWTDGPETTAILKDLKVTARCIPQQGGDPTGACLFTGQPATARVLFAKAY